MISELPEISFKAIGIVRSELKERAPGHRTATATIEIDPDMTEGLDNLDEFTHIIVIFWFHKTRRPAPLKVTPRHHGLTTAVGVFASRSPDRPNPIGKSTVRLLKREGNILTVADLDAIDGTPVLDIKPFIPGIDAAKDAASPPWMPY
jgi:tRNA-Thr(GGU) m(6)t(6)A37 methyltransferase TsaA